jgi:hypothetical protein
MTDEEITALFFPALYTDMRDGASPQWIIRQTLVPFVPTIRRDAFDDPASLIDLKLDGFRRLVDTIAWRIMSKNG